MKKLLERTYLANWVAFVISSVLIFFVLNKDESGLGGWVLFFLVFIPLYYLAVQPVFYFLNYKTDSEKHYKETARTLVICNILFHLLLVYLIVILI